MRRYPTLEAEELGEEAQGGRGPPEAGGDPQVEGLGSRRGEPWGARRSGCPGRRRGGALMIKAADEEPQRGAQDAQDKEPSSVTLS